MRKNISFHFFDILIRLKSFLFLFLILYITTIPAIKIVFHLLDVQHEMCVIYEDNDVKEKEIIVEKEEDKDQEFYFIQNLSSSNIHKCTTDFKPEVPQPPPKKV